MLLLSECPSAQVPKRSKCPSAWVSDCLSALSAQVPQCSMCLSARVPKCPPSSRVPWVLSEYSSARVLYECLKCLSALLGVFKCISRAWMSNQMWLEQNAEHKNMFRVKRKKCKKKKKIVEKNLRKQYNRADLKNFWNWFGISDLCKDVCKILLFVWAPL